MTYDRILAIISKDALFYSLPLVVCALTVGCQPQIDESSAATSGKDATAVPDTKSPDLSSKIPVDRLHSDQGGLFGGAKKDESLNLQKGSTRKQPQITVDQLRESALQALGDGQDDLAFQIVRKAIRMEPGNPQVVFLFAMVLGDRHRYAEAIQILQELAEREPVTRLPALGQTAEWLVESGRYDEAEQQYRTILKEVPDALMVHHRLGQLLLQSGRRTESAMHFDYLSQFGELDQEELRSLLIRSQAFPDDDQYTRFAPLTKLALCRQELASGKIDHVVDLLSEEDDQHSDGEIALLARLRSVSGQAVQESIQQLGSVEANADAWFARGSVALDQQNYPLAVGCFCRALLIDQTDADAYRRLSQALEKNGDTRTSRIAAARAELVEQTRALGADLVGKKGRDRELIAQLVSLLIQLQRPLEALGWQSVDLVYAVEAAAMSETQAQTNFEAIGRQRAQLVDSGKHAIDPAFVLCGLGADALDPTRVVSE